MRLARLKSHQLGMDVTEELNNEYETRVETTADTTGMMIDPSITVNERSSAVILKLNNQEISADEHPNCSTSEDENNLSFANSRTIIKP